MSDVSAGGRGWRGTADFGWEAALVIVLAAVLVMNSQISPHFLNFYNLADSTFNFSEKAMIALAMALLIICREIDLSVAAIIALSSTMMGILSMAGMPAGVIVAGAIATGMLAGCINGLLVTWLRVPSIVATIGTMSLFRGLSYVMLGDRAVTGYPAELRYFGQGYLLGVPFEFWVLLVFVAIFAFVLHATVAGRRLFAIGLNPDAARFSGIRVDRVRFLLFVVAGVMSGLAAVFLTSRIGSTRPNIAQGWELDIITMVVLGGVRIEGGRGTMIGVFVAVLLLGMLNFGLQLLNIPGIVLSIVTGSLLVTVIALPGLGRLARGIVSAGR